MKELQAINQQVVLDLTVNNQEQRTASGIIIPDIAREKPTMARVINMSVIENAEVSVGDMVIYKAFSGSEIEIESRKYLIIPYSDLLAKVVETEII
jgi:chaperonin GroES